MNRFFAFALFCTLPALLAVQSSAAPRPFSLEKDFAKIVTVNDPQISPDGTRVAYVVTRADMSKDQYVSELTMLTLASGEKRNLTPSRHDAGMPRWSPDGTRLAFIAPQSDEPKAKPQVWVLPMDGGEASLVTHAANGVETYAWRPDGKAIAYQSPDDAQNKSEIEKKRDLFTVRDQDYLSQAAPVASHIWIQSVDGGKPQRITQGTWSLPSGQFTGALSWSADGRRIAFTRLPDAYNGHFGKTRASVVDVATKQVVDLTPGNAYGLGPVFAPSGNRVAYQTAHDGLWAFQLDVDVRDGVTGSAVRAAPSVDRDFQGAAFAPDGSLYMTADDRTTTGMWRVDPSGAVSRVNLGDAIGASLPVFSNKGAYVFTAGTVRDPSELYVVADGAAPRRVTDYNAAIEAMQLPVRKEFTWRNDGFDEDGVLTYPLNYTAGRRYPLVLQIHGGPTETASTDRFNEMDAEWSAHGYFVLEPNYRGSDNLGFAYAKGMLGDVDAGPGRDIVAGVKALEAAGLVDASKVGVSGWSGGGLMTSWLIGHYHIWKAAVSGAAVNDFIEEYDLSDIIDYMPALMNGISPWTPAGRKTYIAASPITYASQVTTPTLILSDTGDYRVPAVQAYGFYRALKEYGKNVTFVAIPAYGHFPSDPVRQLETEKRWTGWMYPYL